MEVPDRGSSASAHGKGGEGMGWEKHVPESRWEQKMGSVSIKQMTEVQISIKKLCFYGYFKLHFTSLCLACFVPEFVVVMLLKRNVMRFWRRGEKKRKTSGCNTKPVKGSQVSEAGKEGHVEPEEMIRMLVFVCVFVCVWDSIHKK